MAETATCWYETSNRQRTRLIDFEISNYHYITICFVSSNLKKIFINIIAFEVLYKYDSIQGSFNKAAWAVRICI